MKNIIKCTLIASFLLLTSITASATCDHGAECTGGWGECEEGGSTTAPLDGGLLAILAGAGITYFVIRKKKKDKE